MEAAQAQTDRPRQRRPGMDGNCLRAQQIKCRLSSTARNSASIEELRPAESAPRWPLEHFGNPLGHPLENMILVLIPKTQHGRYSTDRNSDDDKMLTVTMMRTMTMMIMKMMKRTG